MNIFILSIFLSVSSSVVLDNQTSLIIESDSAIYDMTENVTEWKGDVRVVDGVYTLKADALRVTYNQKNQITRIMATGAPVVIAGPLNEDQALLEGKVVVYEQSTRVVTSTGKAKFATGAQQLTSSVILYNLISKRLTASSSPKTTEL